MSARRWRRPCAWALACALLLPPALAGCGTKAPPKPPLTAEEQKKADAKKKKKAAQAKSAGPKTAKEAPEPEWAPPLEEEQRQAPKANY